MTVEPIRPDQVAETKVRIIPDAVIEAFNEEIALHFVDNSSRVLTKDAKARAMTKMKRGDSFPPVEFDSEWLNVEEVYRAAGWKVEFDRPAYNENYDSFFTFRKPK